jgi:hypothetical protein
MCKKIISYLSVVSFLMICSVVILNLPHFSRADEQKSTILLDMDRPVKFGNNLYWVIRQNTTQTVSQIADPTSDTKTNSENSYITTLGQNQTLFYSVDVVSDAFSFGATNSYTRANLQFEISDFENSNHFTKTEQNEIVPQKLFGACVNVDGCDISIGQDPK